VAESKVRARGAAVLACAVCAACVGLSACLSASSSDIQGFDKAPLFGMVYDERNEPCAGARLEIDGSPGPTTDLSGRFTVRELGRGPHRVVVAKAGFERLEVGFDFYDKNQVLYLKVVSMEELLNRIEAALADRKLAEAESLVTRAEAVSPGQTDVRYLKAVLLLRSGDPQRAAQLLEQMAADGGRAPAVYLTLADIYELALGDREKAKASLSAYLRLQEDSAARARLDALSRAAGDGK
jgi:hypothetical protein